MSETPIMTIIESLLFVHGEPLHVRKLAEIVDVPVSEIREALNALQLEYEMRQSGLQLIRMQDAYQIGTVQAAGPYIERMCTTNKSKGMSSSALEVMAIIAYKQPITKGEIDYIRGVKSDKAIQALIDRKLIEEKGRLNKIGKPIIYGTTGEFLKAFGFSSLRELPDISTFENSEMFMNALVPETVDEEENEEHVGED